MKQITDQQFDTVLKFLTALEADWDDRLGATPLPEIDPARFREDRAELARFVDEWQELEEYCPVCGIPRREGQGATYTIPGGQGTDVTTWYCSWQHYRRDMESAGYHFDDGQEEMEDPS